MRIFNKTAGIALGVLALSGLAACGQKSGDEDAAAPANTATAAAPTAAASPPATSIDTVDGTKLASFTGDAAAGEKVFLNCKTCHAVEAGKNMTGPSMHAIIGRTAGSVPGYSYSAANKGSGIVWSEEKLFQYLEAPQRIVVGTKMTYTGLKKPQDRADVIAYLKTQS